ncbi:zinc finger BED domain-containing protein DAYSLEEPER-like protein [Tanacetum coccineum]
MEMIEFYFPLIYPGDSAIRIQKVRKICEALILEYQEKALNSQDESGNNMGSSSTNSVEVDENMSAWEKQSCILRGAKYLVMQAIARDILAIPVSSVASESAFSTSGRLISPHRIRLRPDTIEALMCAQSWLWEIVNKDEGKPFTSDNNATIFDDYDTDGKGEGEGKGEDQVRTKVYTISGASLVVLVKGMGLGMGMDIEIGDRDGKHDP